MISDVTEEKEYILGLDVSTKTIGIALFEDKGDSGDLKLLHHVTPKVKPKPENKWAEMFEKVNIFEKEFLYDCSDLNITRVIIEEPLLRSNNVNTVGTLLRYNGMISKVAYDVLGIAPEYISSYDARKYAFPELMAIRTHNKKGEPYPQKKIDKDIADDRKVLFGAYPWDVDKKEIVWEKISDLEPQITWLYTKNKTLKKENYDMTDAYAACIGYMNMIGKWPIKELIEG
jgi:hypothetical protein